MLGVYLVELCHPIIQSLGWDHISLIGLRLTYFYNADHCFRQFVPAGVSPSIVSMTMDENFTFYSYLTWITEKVWTKEETPIMEQKVLLEVFEEGDLKEDSR